VLHNSDVSGKSRIERIDAFLGQETLRLGFLFFPVCLVNDDGSIIVIGTNFKLIHTVTPTYCVLLYASDRDG
jgi:hypothetical protein